MRDDQFERLLGKYLEPPGDPNPVVVCEDRKEAGIRYLKPITAFEPEAGEAYWRHQ